VVDIYNADTGQWSTASLSLGRYELSALSAGRLAVFAGGMNNSGATNRVDIFDTTSNKWSTETLSNARRLMGAAAVGNTAIFAGGVENGAAVDFFTAVIPEPSAVAVALPCLLVALARQTRSRQRTDHRRR
jgi:hypothetical protein